jgi:hypothetical protein
MAADPKPFKVWVLWGKSFHDAPKEYAFATQAELDAFLYGVEEMDGWVGYSILDGSACKHCGHESGFHEDDGACTDDDDEDEKCPGYEPIEEKT